MDERVLDRKAHDGLWCAFFCPALRDALPADKQAEYEPKFARCKRIDDKRFEIDAEHFYKQTLMLMKMGSNEEEELLDSHAEIQVLERTLGKQFPWYERPEMAAGWKDGPEMRDWERRLANMGLKGVREAREMRDLERGVAGVSVRAVL
jgi:hypothetical protein